MQVVAFRYGQFSHLWIDMLQRLGLDVHVIEERWGDGANEDKLEKVRGVLGCSHRIVYPARRQAMKHPWSLLWYAKQHGKKAAEMQTVAF